MKLVIDDQEPDSLAAAITDLLIRNGYPPDQVSSWWTDWSYDALGGRTPAQAWNDHDYQEVWETIRAAYAASEETAQRLSSDGEHIERMGMQLQELHARYGD